MIFPATGSAPIRNYFPVFSVRQSKLANVTGRLILKSKKTLVHKFVSEGGIE